MSYHVPNHYQQQIAQVAQAQHISTDEAIDRILQAGLERLVPKSEASIPGLTGKPMSDEEAAVMDEVVEAAMNSRGKRWMNGTGA